MQAVKDSFYMAMRDRLAQLNPARTVGEAQRPAIVVAENESKGWLDAPNAFYLRWAGSGDLAPDADGWQCVRCEIGYRTEGTELACGEDRGRLLAELDGELRAITVPRSTVLRDYGLYPVIELGTSILWTSPKFADAKDDAGVLQRAVTVDVIWREDA